MFQSISQGPQKKKGKSPTFFAKAPWVMKAAETKPELNYTAGMVAMDLAAAQAFHLTPLVNELTIVGWNYSDAICSLVVGTAYLLDNESYNQTQIKAKGVINIFSGLQLFFFTYQRHLIQWGTHALTGMTAFAAPAFALAMFCDMVCAIIDFCKAYKELSYEGWKDERQTELKFLNKKIDYYKAKETLNGQLSKSDQKKLDKFIKCREEVEIQMDNCESSHTPTKMNALMKRERQVEATFDKARLNLILKTASFVGMSILAVASFVSCPPLTIVGMVICSLVAAGYIYKHASTIAEIAQKFFTTHPQSNQSENTQRNMKWDYMPRLSEITPTMVR